MHAPNQNAASANAGATAERDARGFLEAKGLTFIANNFRCKLGEIDLVMKDGDHLVFVEVRYRKPSRFGSPLETVDKRKQTKLRNSAQVFLQNQKLGNRHPCRFDVIGIQGDKIDWIKGAF